jgi:hypothetical protein
MNNRTLVIGSLFGVTLVLGAMSLYIGSTIGNSNEPVTDPTPTDVVAEDDDNDIDVDVNIDTGGTLAPSDASANEGVVCGETCTQDSDCQGSTVNGVTVTCENNRCVNAACPGNTIYGTRCDCDLATRNCGEPCGGSFALCGSGTSCTYRAQAAPYCDDETVNPDQPNNSTAVCVPTGSGANARGEIVESLYGSNLNDLSTWDRFSREQCIGRPDEGNNYLSHPELPGEVFDNDQFIKDYVCGEKLVYTCNSTNNTCEGIAIASLSDPSAAYATLAQCQQDCGGSTCGNGIVETGEQCDEGSLNGTAGEMCNTLCQVPICDNGLDDDGDGLIDIDDPECHTDGDPSNPASWDPNRQEAALPATSISNNVIQSFFLITGFGLIGLAIYMQMRWRVINSDKVQFVVTDY